MSVYETLFSASFKFIPFLMDSSDLSAGRKTVTHEYPNKDFRYVEDLGKNLRTYNIRGTISDSDGFLYRAKRLALQIAFDTPSPGIFIHPIDGAVNVSCTTYTFSEDLTRLGECSFTATFLENFENIYPASVTGVPAIIGQLTDAMRSQLGGFLATGITMVFKKNIPDTATKVTNLNTKLNDFPIPVNKDDNALNIFKANSAKFVNTRYELIQEPAELSASTVGILSDFNALALTSEDGYKLNSLHYEFGNDDTYINPITNELIERDKNRKSLNSVINAVLLMNLYDNAKLITYLDDIQLNTISADLENKYQYLLANNNLSDDILYQLENIRNEIRKFLYSAGVTVNKVITIDTKPIPLTALLYTYYEDFDNEDEIISLNNIFDPTKLEGQIRILTG